jgi:glycosyltransferase involved in cell wall biosynthesis
LLTHERVGFVEPARRIGFAAATGDWIINIDADEVVTPGLGKRLRELVESDAPYDVVLVPRINVYVGRWLRHTPWWPGKPRFFRNGQMTTSPRIHHGFQPVEGGRIGTNRARPEGFAVALFEHEPGYRDRQVQPLLICRGGTGHARRPWRSALA